MTHHSLLPTVLGLAMIAISPASVEIHRNFENPVNGMEASDVGVVSGWVYSSTGNPVTVQLFVDGVAQEIIPCCGPRPDVVAAESGAPANTGFRLLRNAKRLSPRQHTIAVQFSATGETPVTETHTVTVVKPGGRSGEDPEMFFSFLSDLEIDDANVALDANAGEIIVAPVSAYDRSAGDGGSGQTRPATLRLSWFNGRQSFNIVSSTSGPEFANVQPILTNRCAVPGCHDGGGTSLPGSLDLREGHAFRSLVAVKSTEISSHLRVNPRDDDASYLHQKIIASPTSTIAGVRMPRGCSGTSCLSGRRRLLTHGTVEYQPGAFL